MIRPLNVSLAILFASAAIASAQDSAKNRGQHALLIGVSRYPSLEDRYQLAGPANDVLLMRDALESQFGFPKNNIAILAEHQGEAGWPTRANIEKQFRRLAETVQSGDQIVILMAGHGSQQPEPDNAKIPEPDGLDEIFLPRDVGPWDGGVGKVGNAIIDDEIGDWLDAIRAKGATVMAVFDSCHSGTMTRGAGERERSISPSAGLKIPAEVLKAAGNKAMKKSTVKSRGGASEVSAAAGLVAIYACQSSEVTVELDLPANSDDSKAYGLLTFTLVQILKQSSRPPTYRELLQRVHGHYAHLGRTAPTPQMEAAGSEKDRETLGIATWPGRSIIALKQDGKAWTIDAGSLSGLTEGTILAVHPTGDRVPDQKPIGHVKITRLKTLSATVEPCEFQGVALVDSLPRLGRCEIVMVDYGLQKLRVAVDPLDGLGKTPAKAGLDRLAGELAKLSKSMDGLMETVDDPAQASWFVRLDGNQVVLVPASFWTSRGPDRAKNAFGPWPLDEQLAGQLRTALERIVRAENLKKMASAPADGVARGSGKSPVALEMVRYKSEDDRQGETVAEVEPFAVRNDDIVGMRVKNQANYAVDITLLYVDKNYGIAAWYPDPDRGEINRLKPGETLTVPRVTVSAETDGSEYVVAIAVKASTKAPLDFTFLAQPALDRTRGDQAAKTPLGSLLESSLFGGQTRAITRRAVEEYSLRLIPWQVKK